jgi:hypothetical protein
MKGTMELLIKLMLGGGLFAVLSFIHYGTDFVFQSHTEAMVKHNNAKIRAKHCLIYTLGFVPILLFVYSVGALLMWEVVICLLVLFFSHFYLDTYHGVYLWAKYLRRPPEMTQPRQKAGADGYILVLPPDAKAGFVEFVQTTLGKILMISIDQLSHLTFLWMIVWLVMRHLHLDIEILNTISCHYPRS